mmetsp:Transcript_33496/g.44213  ORF Transcript_33496/g.44213 Transcript_33496/m.44213 type:complete len:511 (-) Transcript_33496:321-1853(-)
MAQLNGMKSRNGTTKSGRLPRDLESVDFKSREDLQRFVAKGGDINSRNSKGFSVLHKLCEDGNLKMIKFVINDLQGDPAVRDRAGLTPLHWSSMRGHLDVVKYLAETIRVDVADVDNSGHSALHLALANNNVQTYQYLIKLTVARRIAMFKAEVDETSSLDLARALSMQVAPHIPEVSLENIYLLSVKAFIKGGAILSYGDLASQGVHVNGTVLTPSDRVLFVIHQWEGRREPDPGKNQFKMIRKFLQDWQRDNQDQEINYIWLDYSCLTQEKYSGGRVSADYRFQLPNVLSATFCATHCLVVPRITTVGDNPCTDLKGLFNRGWCQVELALAMLTGTQLFCCYWYGRSQNPNCVQKIVPVDFLNYESQAIEVPLSGFKAASMKIMDKHKYSEVLRAAVTEIWTIFPEPPINFKAIVAAIIALRKMNINQFEKLCSMTLRYEYIKSDLPLHEIYWDLGEFRVADDRTIAFNILMMGFSQLTGMMDGVEFIRRSAPACHCLGAESMDCNVM